MFTYNAEDLSWRRAIFLPFNFYWRIFIAVTCFVNVTLIIFEQIFLMRQYTSSFIVNVMMLSTICYAVDVLLSIIHRIWPAVQKSMPDAPKHVAIIFIDILSLIPTDALFEGSLLSESGKIEFSNIWCLNACLRLYRVYVELLSFKDKMGVNAVLLCLIQHNMLMFCLSSLIGCVWYVIGYVFKDNLESWLSRLNANNPNIQMDNPIVAYIVSFIDVYAKLNNAYTVESYAAGTLESAFCTILFYFGFLLRYCYMISTMVRCCIKEEIQMCNIRYNVSINKKFVERKDHKQIEDYYVTFWNNFLGLRTCPLLDKIPLCFQKDIRTDIYWSAMTHSHVLRDLPINVKREISLYMESKSMQPGDYLFRKGELRTSFFYLASGVVKIMSHYDCTAPIMTLQCGSCIGNAAVLVPTVCPTDIRCATVCELHILRFQEFYEALKHCPNTKALLNQLCIAHIGYAKIMYVLSRVYKRDNVLMAMYDCPQENRLKWIKSRWRTIMDTKIDMTQATNQYLHKLRDSAVPFELTRTSKHLDLIVLSKQEKWDEDNCCFKTTYPYVLEPACHFIKLWHVFIVIMATIDCLTVPTIVTYLPKVPPYVSVWDHIMCFTYLLDTYFQSITAVRTVEITITEPCALIRHHCTRVEFLIDVVAAIPIRELYRLLFNETPNDNGEYLSLLRLFKLLRVYQFFQIQQDLVTAKTATTHFLRLVYMFTMSSLICACFAFMMSCLYKVGVMVCVENSWYVMFSKNLRDPTTIEQILSSLLHAGKIYWICGMDPELPVLFSDALFSTAVIFIAGNLKVFAFSELMAMWIMEGRQESACKEQIALLKSSLQQKGLHPGLTNMMNTYMLLQWNESCAIDHNPDRKLSDILSPAVLENKRKTVNQRLMSIPFFNQLKPEIFNNICNHSKQYTVPNNYIFCRSGERPCCFNVIVKGCCHLTSMLKQDVLEYPDGKLLKPGDWFSLFEILLNIPSVQTTVSLTTCDVVTIRAATLKRILFQSSSLIHDIKLSFQFQTDELDIVVSRKRYKGYEPKKRNFLPRVLNKRNDKKQRSFIGRCLSKSVRWIFDPPFIIHPEGNFLLIWEGIMFFQTIIMLIYIPYVYLHVCKNRYIYEAFSFFLHLFTIADIYVGFHVGYYNKEGVVINKKTHYLSRSFTVNFIAALPVFYILRDYNFRTKLRVSTATKILRIYKISGFIMALKRKFELHSFTVITTNVLVHLVLVVYICGTCLFARTCEVLCINDVYSLVCQQGTWLHSNSFYEKTTDTAISMLLSSLHMALATVISSDTGNFYIITPTEMKVLFVVTIITCILKYIHLPAASAYLMESKISFTKYREKSKHFRFFIVNEGAGDDIANQIINHASYNYNRSSGIDLKALLKPVHPSLRTDLMFAMYYKCVKCLHRFLGESRSFMMVLTCELGELYFLKGSTIIDYKELNDKIYFVAEGQVSVVSEDKIIKRLKLGSMFGTFRNPQVAGKTRQKYKFVASIHCCILVIETREFMEIFKVYNKNEAAIFFKMMEDREYFSVTKDKNKDKQDITEEDDMNMTVYKFLFKGSAFYKNLMFLLSLVIPYLTIFPLMIIFLFDINDSSVGVWMFYTFDAIMAFRIIIGLNASYIDNKTGVYITDTKVIRKKYLLHPLKFPLDFLSLIPFEIIWFIFTNHWVSALRLNRLLRLIMIVKHIIQYRNAIYVRLWMRWFSFVALVTVFPFAMIVLWILFLCDKNSCKFIREQEVVLTKPVDIFMYAAHEVITLTTLSSSTAFTRPHNDRDCVLILIVGTLAYMMIPFIISNYAIKCDMSNYKKKKYEYDIQCMHLFLQLRDLSESLLLSLWKYMLLFWTANLGDQILPQFVVKAPNILKCELLCDLYGGHLIYNLLFDECSDAFLIQLSGCIKRDIYFPGDIIIRKFDADGRMYFINSGEVEAVEYDSMNNEIVNDIFITGQCFGLPQGISERLVHMITYKARSTVDIIYIQREDLWHLMNAFPRDKQKVMQIADDIFESLG